MSGHRVVTRGEWLQERVKFLAEEKELTRRADELAQRRKQLPWVRVEKKYLFDTHEGEKTLAELFDGRSQLMVYHFMFGPNWGAGCPGCTLHADSFDRAIAHLNQRGVTMLCASRAPLEKLDAYKKRMGWAFRWVSSGRSDFNFDFAVSYPENAGTFVHNFTAPWKSGTAEEHAGLSTFVLDGGEVFHAYSCYTRGLEPFNAMYQLLDRAPRGRDEEGLAQKHGWIKRRDEYGEAAS
jgi:predicted dithiol-disulfide oxidoreductase (DUF899 family)